MTLSLILLPLALLIAWAFGILAPLLGVTLCLVYFAWRKYAR